MIIMQVAQTYDKFEQCLECLGTGKIEKLICTKPVSECCGGCYTYKECKNCNGTGEVIYQVSIPGKIINYRRKRFKKEYDAKYFKLSCRISLTKFYSSKKLFKQLFNISNEKL